MRIFLLERGHAHTTKARGKGRTGPTEYDFEQLCAEAVNRIGQPLVISYLETVARNIGWPIRAEDYDRVGFGLACLVSATEQGGATDGRTQAILQLAEGIR